MTKHDSKTADEYYEGMGCKCMARYQGDCACDDVDWTPKEVYELRKKNAELEKMLIKLVDDDCNEWYRLEILNLLNGIDNL